MQFARKIISVFLIVAYTFGVARAIHSNCNYKDESHHNLEQNTSHHHHNHHTHSHNDDDHSHILHKDHLDSGFLDFMMCIISDLDHPNSNSQQEVIPSKHGHTYTTQFNKAKSKPYYSNLCFDNYLVEKHYEFNAEISFSYLIPSRDNYLSRGPPCSILL